MPTRNAESRFAQNPTNIDISRSKFERNSTVKTSFNAGLLIPFYYDDVLPGDTFKVRASKVVRMSTLITPLMDNLWLDTYWFFVPNRLVWEHWKEFMGENTQSAWLPATEYSIPQLAAPEPSRSGIYSGNGWDVGTIADYLGVPTGVPDLRVSWLPFRAYALIWNEWFRDQNLQDPIPVAFTDSGGYGTNTTANSSNTQLLNGYYRGGYPAPVNKYHDLFTSALPAPQKGQDVTISVTSGGLLPVFAMDDVIPKSSLPQTTKGVQFYRAGSDPLTYSFQTVGAEGTSNFTNQQLFNSGTSGTNPKDLFPANLYAGDSGSLSVATVNQLRTAFQIQRFLEKDARGGTRYIEMLKAHFGVTSPDYRLQRPEYLGGSRVPIRISQVVQNSATDSTSPQGNTAGFSLTTDVEDSFTKSFTEHGMILGLLCVRYAHSYQQGLPRAFSRKTRFDFYWPVFANIGEMAIKNKEIYAQGPAVVDTDGNQIDEQVFGYQEAWADYRYKPNQITGMMRSTYSASLDSWHLGDLYSSLPTLSAGWIKEDGSIIDRTLAVTSAVSHQFIADIFIENAAVRPMPLYSIPGLIDHH